MATLSTFSDPVAALRDSRLVELRAAGLGAFFRPGQVEKAGVDYDALQQLVLAGEVEHVARGLYRFADAEITENYSLAAACARVPRSIVCLLSALRVHELGTQLPREVWLAIPHRARAPKVEGVPVRLVRFSDVAWTYGVQDTSFEGVPARITSPARTVVDCFRFAHLLGRDVAREALRDGLRQGKVSREALGRVLEVLPCRPLRQLLDGMDL